MNWKLYRVAILTASDKGAAGKREDLSGPAAKEIMEQAGYTVVDMRILPDERQLLSETMKEICDKGTADLILTTGGTGFSPEIGHRKLHWILRNGRCRVLVKPCGRCLW